MGTHIARGWVVQGTRRPVVFGVQSVLPVHQVLIIILRSDRLAMPRSARCRPVILLLVALLCHGQNKPVQMALQGHILWVLLIIMNQSLQL